MTEKRSKTLSKEKGFVLVVVLLFLTLLSSSAFLSMEQGQLSYKVNQVRVAKEKALFLADYALDGAIKNIDKLLAENEPDLAFESEKLIFEIHEDEGVARVHARIYPPKTLKQGNSMRQNQYYHGQGAGAISLGSVVRRVELRSFAEVTFLGGSLSRTVAADIQTLKY